MPVLYIDESGGLGASAGSFLVLAGVVLEARDATRAIKRLRNRVQWTDAEVKGTRMTDQDQAYLLRGALTAPARAAAIISEGSLAGALVRADSLGEHQVYAAMAADLICGPPLAECEVTAVIADGGRYVAGIMRQLPEAIEACIRHHQAGRVPRVEFVQSHRLPGIQIADVLANRIFRAYRAVQEEPHAGRSDEIMAGAEVALHAVPVQPCSMRGLQLPKWAGALPTPDCALSRVCF